MPSLIPRLVAQRIRQYRKAKKLTQAELANQMKIGENTLSRWESMIYSPSVVQLAELAEVLQIPVVSFFADGVQADPGRTSELLGAARELNDRDLDEVICYTHFKRATAARREKE